MRQGKTGRMVMDYILILVGTCLIALAVQSVYDPIGMVTGGFSGIAIIVKAATEGIVKGGVPLWLTNLVLNIPVFIVAYIVKGKRFIGRTAIATIALSVWLYVLPVWNFIEGDYILASIFGGIICGAGVGLVLHSQATTGGTDMVAVLLQHKLFRHYSVAQIMQILDGAIVVIGIALFGIKVGLYAIVAIFITTKVADALTEGVKFSRVAYIITKDKEKVSAAIIETLNRGVTGLMAKGMYSGQEKCMLYCVVSKKEVVELKELVMDIDPDAFVIVTDAREVLGEGFIQNSL